MLRRKITSALFIDFQNMAGQLGADFAASIPAWLAWLEDGAFDSRRSRRHVLERRMYCDASNYKRHAATFAQHGFTVIPTAADLAIALDALECTYVRKRIEEYIILTVDQDFAPLLEKLGDRRKQRIVTVQEGTASANIFPDRAEIVIPLGRFKGALRYTPPLTLLARASKNLKKAKASLRAAKGFLQGAKRRLASLVETAHRAQSRAGRSASLVVGAKHLATLAHKTPRFEVGRRTVMRYLKAHMPELSNARFLGCKDYADMIQQMVELRDDLLLIRKRNGGVAVMAAPP
jgi:hypothetical protein